MYLLQIYNISIAVYEFLSDFFYMFFKNNKKASSVSVKDWLFSPKKRRDLLLV